MGAQLGASRLYWGGQGWVASNREEVTMELMLGLNMKDKQELPE